METVSEKERRAEREAAIRRATAIAPEVLAVRYRQMRYE